MMRRSRLPQAVGPRLATGALLTRRAAVLPTLPLATLLTLAAGAAAAGAMPAEPAAAVQAQAPTPDPADAFWNATRNGDAATVKKLLEAGVDVNTKFRYGATALAYACDRGHLEVVKVLLAQGANVNVKDTFYNATPLSWAASPAQARKPQHAEIVALLLKAGAEGKEQALFSAVRAADEPMAQAVLQHGGLSAETLADALEVATSAEKASMTALLERSGARAHPTVALGEAQLARYAGAYSDGSTELSFTVKDGRLQGGPPGQSSTFLAKDETSFRVAGRPGLTLTFALDGEKARTATVKQGSSTTVYKRVEGK